MVLSKRRLVAGSTPDCSGGQAGSNPAHARETQHQAGQGEMVAVPVLRLDTQGGATIPASFFPVSRVTGTNHGKS